MMGFRLDYSLVLPGFDSISTKTHLSTLWCHFSRVFLFSHQADYQGLPAPYLIVLSTSLAEGSSFPSLLGRMTSPASFSTCFLGGGGHLGPPDRQYFGGQGLLHLRLSDGLGVLRSKRCESHHSSLGASNRAPLAAFDCLCASLAVSHLSFLVNSLGISKNIMFYFSHCVLVLIDSERRLKLWKE